MSLVLSGGKIVKSGGKLAAISPNGDWALRSAAAGILLAAPLTTSSELAAYAFAGAETVPPSFDSTMKPFGQTGSIKFTSDPSDTTQSGTLQVPFCTVPNSIGQGGTLVVAFRQYMTNDHVYQLHVLDTSPSLVPNGFKQILLSDLGHSHVAYEVAYQNDHAQGAIRGYANGGTFTGWEQGYTPSGLPFDFKQQPAIGNDGSGSISPDSIYSYVNGGTDPDDGTPFSNSKTNPLGGTLQQIEWSRIGGSFNAQQDPANAYGLGHPLAGQMRYPRNQWATYLYVVNVGTWGSPNTRIRGYCAPEGLGYVKLVDEMFTLDADTDPGFNTVWPLLYTTLGLAGGRSVTSRSNGTMAACTNILTVGLGTATGAGTLSYTAATKRFTWAESGGSAGTARGVSSQKTLINCYTSGGAAGYLTGQYLGVEVPSFAALPGTDQTDTITIAGNRKTSNSWFSEILVGTQMTINATAFNAAGVQVGPTGGYTAPP